MSNFVGLATEITEFIEKKLKGFCDLCCETAIRPSFWTLTLIEEINSHAVLLLSLPDDKDKGI